MRESGGSADTMIRILHAADLHLDSPFQGLSREKAAQRRGEQRGMLLRIAQAAREQQADLVLLAGDLFDADSPYSETARLLEQVLPQIGVPVFIAPGNHDWYGPRSPWARLSLGENVHVFHTEDIRCVELPALGARVWGAAFTARHRSPPLAGFRPEKIPGVADILVLHGEVGAPNSPYGAISEADIAASGMDYIALGHVHAGSGLCRAGDTFYAWPGCPEGRGFDETGEKGVLLTQVEPGACRTTFLPLGGRRYEILRVDLTGSGDAAAAVADALGRDTSRDVYRIILTGEPAAAPDMAALRGALEGRFFALELRDETHLRRDVWDGREVLSLRGIFLAGLWEKYQAAQTDDERAAVELAARYGLQAMENGEEPPLG